MRNSKDFSIPENIPHASGLFLAYSMARITCAVLFVLILVSLTLLSKEKLFLDALVYFITPAFIIIVSLFGYFSGFRDPQEITKYLYFLRQKFNKEVIRLDSRRALDEAVDEKMDILTEKIKCFFDPLILNFLRVNPLKKDFEVEYAKADNIFNAKLNNVRSKNLKKIGEDFLREKIYDIITTSISQKKRIKFDENWVKDLDMSFFQEKAYNAVRHRFFLEKEDLNKKIQRIDELIRDSSQEKVFS